MSKEHSKLYRFCLHAILYSSIPTSIAIYMIMAIVILFGVLISMGVYTIFNTYKLLSFATIVNMGILSIYVNKVVLNIPEFIFEDLFHEAKDLYYSEKDPELRMNVYRHMDWLRSNKF